MMKIFMMMKNLAEHNQEQIVITRPELMLILKPKSIGLSNQSSTPRTSQEESLKLSTLSSWLQNGDTKKMKLILQQTRSSLSCLISLFKSQMMLSTTITSLNVTRRLTPSTKNSTIFHLSIRPSKEKCTMSKTAEAQFIENLRNTSMNKKFLLLKSVQQFQLVKSTTAGSKI